MIRKPDRRSFVKQTSIAGAGFWLAGGIAGAQDKKSALEGLRFAGVGVGGKGGSDIDQAGALGEVVGICDIDDNTLGKKGEKFTKAKKYNDFRKMLEEMGKDIDAVVIGTPDHTHAPAAAMAMRMGKHVYVQKPLTHTVKEARVLRELAVEKKVCTQMGNQGTAENGLREAVEIIRAGVIGQVKEVHVWTNRPIWPQAPKVTTRPTGTHECPKHVHWDEFIGPSQMRPYAPGYHPFAWRGWWDFGTGALGDMACHTANMAFMALKLGHPTSVLSNCEKPMSKPIPVGQRLLCNSQRAIPWRLSPSTGTKVKLMAFLFILPRSFRLKFLLRIKMASKKSLLHPVPSSLAIRVSFIRPTIMVLPSEFITLMVRPWKNPRLIRFFPAMARAMAA